MCELLLRDAGAPVVSGRLPLGTGRAIPGTARTSVRLIAASQHARGFISHHDFVPLVLDLNARHDNAAIAFRGRTHGAYLDLAMDGVADPHRRQDLLPELEHGEPGALNHALAQE